MEDSLEIDGNSSLAESLRVLVVDNDKAHARSMEESLARVGYACVVALSGPEGVECIEHDAFDLIVTDLVMNEVDGIGVLAKAKEYLPDCEVIVVTGHATVPKAVEAMKLGAFNFLEKPLTPDKLRAAVAKAAEAVALKRTNLALLARLDEKFGMEGIVFASPKMNAVVDRIRRVAPTDVSVLIGGETGTGKELIAQAIHQNSPRKRKPFVALNCGAVAEHLVESELFGHVKGAFTDASTDRVGKFEYANGGTIFLDEVGDMPIATQIKLLRVLEERKITRVGDNKAITVNVRVLSATNRDLHDAIERGEFRRDLYHRLKVVSIDLPPLRERREDIVPLVDHYRKRLAKQHGKTIKAISPTVVHRLFTYDWPGNVRELINAINTMVVLDQDGVLDVDDLPPELDVAETRTTPGGSDSPIATGSLEALVGRPLAEIEKLFIGETLKFTAGNREKASELLGIGARTLYRKIKEFDL
jgi:two-component system response regulator HydG